MSELALFKLKAVFLGTLNPYMLYLPEFIELSVLASAASKRQ